MDAMTAPDSGPEARTITREQLAAALQQARGEHLDIGPCTIEIADADAIFAALPAAAPAPGDLRGIASHEWAAGFHDAAPAEGLREALERHIDALVALGRTMVLRADLAQIGEQVAIVVNDIPDLRAALARHESPGSET
jgi:hypothetical protein